MTRLVAALLLALLAGCQTVPTNRPDATAADARCSNRQVVLDFYQRALVDKDVRGGFETFMTPDFIEHKPDVAGGSRENVILFLEGLMKELPAARWQVVRSLGEGDLVAVHARFQPAAGAPEYAIADFFRVAGCRIVEHWDVVAPPSDKAVNPNPRF